MVLLHGGYWLDSYGADLMDPLAADLRRRGHATWNVEYRRVGSGGGFPATFTDVAAALDKVPDLDLPQGLPVRLVGHSAGGQLAAWAASRTARTPGGAAAVPVDLTISLSGVLDLRAAERLGLGNGAVPGLMGGTAAQRAAAYALADPSQLLPAHGRVVAVHARDDELVPVSQSRGYVEADIAAKGESELVLVPGGHFDLIDPGSDAWATVLGYLDR